MLPLLSGAYLNFNLVLFELLIAELHTCENCDFVHPVKILTLFTSLNNDCHWIIWQLFMFQSQHFQQRICEFWQSFSNKQKHAQHSFCDTSQCCTLSCSVSNSYHLQILQMNHLYSTYENQTAKLFSVFSLHRLSF